MAIWVACYVATLGAAAALNWAVDPYAVFGTVFPGVSSNKPGPTDHPTMSKVYLLERSHPNTLLIGASRVDIGMDPESPGWPASQRPVFNFGVPGAGLPGQANLLRHALAVTQPKKVFIGIGLDDCFVMPSQSGPTRQTLPKPEPEAVRLAVTRTGDPKPRQWRGRFDDTVTAFLSISSLTDSVRTLLQQGSGSQKRMTPLGFDNGMDFVSGTQAEGAIALFLQKDENKIAQLIPWSNRQAFDVSPLADMLAAGPGRDIEFVVFIYPNSGDVIEIVRRLGAAGTFDRWREQVTQVVAQASRNGVRVVLWDFSGFTPYQTEAVPPRGNYKQLKWFWETNHFKPALGELLIARMQGGGDKSFGVLLNPANLAAVQQRFDSQLRDFVETNPDVVQRIDSLYRPLHQRYCATHAALCDQPPTASLP